ncbi:hypothetical protein [Apilactobacillus xinyiensis]|uniref:hypothetical protein n=1 Tax=Apilactobacillus xinyiensis TaxID=2841032 RepID=UPI001C7D9B33|nr:hypothetical protein [Apilactobacillus xinyiensis]MCL0312267.1 hypothetical protein [Apilactobacillus xinyiensis]
MDFCENCGNDLLFDHDFCYQCGYNINNPQDSYVVNVDMPAINYSKRKQNRDFKAAEILKYKNRLSLHSGIENVFIAQVANKQRIMSCSYVMSAILDVEFFVLSFEDAGIVMLGMDMRGCFDSNNIFIPRNAITTIHSRRGLMHRVLKFSTGRLSFKLLLPSLVIGSPYQKANLAHLQRCIAKY